LISISRDQRVKLALRQHRWTSEFPKRDVMATTRNNFIMNHDYIVLKEILAPSLSQ
jgi:hypothetical protein